MPNAYFLLLLAAPVVNSCRPDGSGIISPVPQTLSCPSYHVSARPTVFETSFFNNAVVQQDSLALHLTRSYLGCIPVSSGRIIATDPVSMGKEPFTTGFPKGRFPVELAVAHFGTDERVAFARIVFSPNKVVRWEMALLAGQKPLPVGGEAFHGYPVDAGSALFIDAAHINGIHNYLNNQGAYERLFIKSFELEPGSKLYRKGFVYAAQSDTLAAFETGWGDGSYATYVGFDDQNHPCRLLTDFQVISW